MKKAIIALFILIICISSILFALPGSSQNGQQAPLNIFALNKYRIEHHSNDSNIFVIHDKIDLRGETLKIPPKSKIKFEGGIIINGIIQGDSTEIEYDEMPLFDKIEIIGSWKIGKISTRLFSKTDALTAKNLSALSSDLYENTISIDSDFHVDIKAWDSFFKIKSNSTVIFNADIFTNPTEHKGGYCMKITGENITIIGNNHFLFGTVSHPEQKSCWEWLHGLSVEEQCKNISISDLNCWFFCGDGFSFRGNNILLENATAKFNGRQGLSITNGTNIRVINSKFTHTGFYRIASGGGPGAGIDIEPNKDDSVGSVLIQKCILQNNYRYMQGHLNDLEVYDAKGGNITIDDCFIGGIYLGKCSNINILNCEGINSIFRLDNDIENLKVSNSGTPEIFSRK